MTHRVLAVAAIVPALGCAARGPAAAPPIAQASRVVMLSLDGAAATRHVAMVRSGAYPDPDGLAAFARDGLTFDRAIPVEPALTAVSHASLATGALPAVTGIVGDRFHRHGGPVLDGVSGLDESWGAEALWQSFRRQGKRVGVLAFPGCDRTSPARSADFGMIWVDVPLAAADEIVLYGADFTSPVVSAAGRGEAPARACRLPVTFGNGSNAARVEFSVTALDRTADGLPQWDTLRFDNDDSLADGVLAEVRAGEWFALRVDLPHPDGGRRLVGAWCLLQRLDPDLAEVRIYRSAFYATDAYPRAFRERLDGRLGCWPGPPDERALAAYRRGAGGLEPGQVLEQARRFSDFLTAATRLALAEESPDLLIACQPILDEMEHAFLIVDPRQSAYSPARVGQAAELRGEAWRIADHAVGEIARGLDFRRDAFFVVSDHGMVPVWQEIRINQILVDAGLAHAERGERGWQVQADSRMVAFASGGCAHLVVNQAGREAGGVVAAGDAAEVVRQAALQLSRVQVDGESVVEAMFTRDQLAAIGLASPNSGDLIVFLRPGATFSARVGGRGAEITAPSTTFGQGGYRSRHRDMAALFLARGAGIERGAGREISLLELAGRLARVAGVTPPRQAGTIGARQGDRR